MVTIRSFANIREIIGSRAYKLETNQSNFLEVLNELFKLFPDLKKHLYADGKINNNYVFSINDQTIESFNDLTEIPVKDTDTIYIIPPSGGGLN